MFLREENILSSGGLFVKKEWKTYLFWILLTEGTGFLAAFLTRDGMVQFQKTAAKPSFMPPAIVFQVVWPFLYALMGIGIAKVWLTAPRGVRQTGINLFIAQLIFQFFWPLLFFNANAYGLSFYWLILLWVLILLMILAFRQSDRAAALLQIPYWIWVSFGLLLNGSVWKLNWCVCLA